MATTTTPATRTPSPRVHSVMNSVRDFTPHEKRELVIMLTESIGEKLSETDAEPKSKDNTLLEFFGALSDFGPELREDIYNSRRSSTRVYDL